MNTLLVPTDFSTVSDNALQYAIDMAKQHQLNITLFHVVIPSNVTLPNTIVDLSIDFQTETEQKLQEKVGALQISNPSVQFDFKLGVGLFLDTLQQHCDDMNPIAIVMGITGDGNAVDKLIGSNTIFAMKSIHVPLMVVPKHAKFNPVRNICFACDLQHVANATPVLAIKAFAKLFEAKIHILNIDHNNRHFTPNTPDEIDVLNIMFENIETEFHFIDNEYMPDAINDFIDRNGMDMLLMLPKKHSFLESLFKKSQTKEMLYQSHIPILALQP